jgi:hypothetical protein
VGDWRRRFGALLARRARMPAENRGAVAAGPKVRRPGAPSAASAHAPSSLLSRAGRGHRGGGGGSSAHAPSSLLSREELLLACCMSSPAAGPVCRHLRGELRPARSGMHLSWPSIRGYSRRSIHSRSGYPRILETADPQPSGYPRILQTAVPQPLRVSADTRNSRSTAVPGIRGYSRRPFHSRSGYPRILQTAVPQPLRVSADTPGASVRPERIRGYPGSSGRSVHDERKLAPMSGRSRAGMRVSASSRWHVRGSPASRASRATRRPARDPHATAPTAPSRRQRVAHAAEARERGATRLVRNERDQRAGRRSRHAGRVPWRGACRHTHGPLRSARNRQG